MMQPGPEFDSLFRYIVVVSQRAEQIINGARVRSDSRRVKPTLQAVDDVNAGLVQWRILTQEEIDAQRQAIVEQFRAEVGADRMQAESRPRLRDVLPTTRPAVEPHDEVVEPEPGERDEELSRLQRLLGIGDRGHGEDSAELDEDLELADEDEEPEAGDVGFALDLADEEEPDRDELVDDEDAKGDRDEFVEDEEEGYLEDGGDPDEDSDDE